MFRHGGWVIEGVPVLRGDVARWMATVGSRCPRGEEQRYVRDYRVVEKIAKLKAAGALESVMVKAASQMGVAVPLAPASDDDRVPLPWDKLTAANDDRDGSA
ncbi:hypothetical protein BH11PSE9_BH11PSE9_21040 [soil metagenome]